MKGVLLAGLAAAALVGAAAAAEREERGLVTYVYGRVSPTGASHQFIYRTGGAYRRCWHDGTAEIRPGDRVSILGRDDREWSKGDFFNASTLTICGHEEPPPAVRVGGRDLADDGYLNRVVIAEGTVTDVLADDVDDRIVIFQLTDGDVSFYSSAYFGTAGLDDLRDDYLGAYVTVQGPCEPHCGERYFGNRSIHLEPGERPRILRRRLDDPRRCPPLRAVQSIPPNVLCDGRYHSVSGTVQAVLDGARVLLLRSRGRNPEALHALREVERETRLEEGAAETITATRIRLCGR